MEKTESFSYLKVYLFVAVISTLTLCLELLQTRILSVTLLHHFVYIVVTIGLLGFAASGTALAVSGRIKNVRINSFYFICLLGFSVTSYLSCRYSFFPIRNMCTPSPDPRIAWNLILAYSIAIMPYFFAGLLIGASLMFFRAKINKIYGVNMITSGLGCIFFILAMPLFGAPKLVLLVSIVPAICALMLFKNISFKQRLIVILWLSILSGGFFLSDNSWLLRIDPEGNKMYWKTYKHTHVELTRWDALSRIDVISNVDDPMDKRILMDGDAPAKLYSASLGEKMFLDPWYINRHAAFLVQPIMPESELVIGSGGGFEVMLADHYGVRSVEAVEINPITASLVKNEYAAFLGNLFDKRHINLTVEDGRSFVRRSSKKFDIIMISTVDSFLALSTGAYVLMDNYLYTRQAFSDYFDHLSSDGVIQVTRWHYGGRPRETLRIFATALEVLRDKGYINPCSHIFIFSSNEMWADLLLKKTPFSKKDKEMLFKFCRNRGLDVLFTDEFLADSHERSAYVLLANHFLQGREKNFYNNYEFKVSPVTDDSPFFYEYARINTRNEDANSWLDRIRGRWHVFVLCTLLLHALIFSFILVVLPLLLKRKFTASNNFFAAGTYFFSIGFGFMLAEMAIIQKFVLFLGHPIYSLAIVMPVMLLGAGSGSLVSSVYNGFYIRRIIMSLSAGAAFLLIAYFFIIDMIMLKSLSQVLWLRGIITATVILPLAFCMGWLFPLGLRCVLRQALPMAWSLNAIASVLASIIAIIIAMNWGFKAVFLAGAASYIAAACCAFYFCQTGKDKA